MLQVSTGSIYGLASFSIKCNNVLRIMLLALIIDVSNPYILIQTNKCILNQLEIYLLREPTQIYGSITTPALQFLEIKPTFCETSEYLSDQTFDLDYLKIYNVDENALDSMRGKLTGNRIMCP